MSDEQDRFSRRGTARALVLLASGFAVAGGLIVCLCALLLFPNQTGGVVLAALLFVGIVIVAAVLANLLAIRGRSLVGVVTLGCGTLLAGVIIGLAVLLLLISNTA